jgi:hypothetical protein
MNEVATIKDIPFTQLERMATSIAKSGFFGAKTPEQAMALMLIAQAEGVHPAVAARDFHVIQGRPALKADAMLARFQSAGGRVRWIVHTDEAVRAEFSHPSGGTLEIEWTMDRAKQAGLAGRDQWKAYPRQMLRARVISEGVRAVFPGVAVGTYTVEELKDVDPPAEPGTVTVQPAATVKSGMDESEYADHLAAIDECVELEALKAAFATGYRRAQALNDKSAAMRLEAAYGARKHALGAA